MEPRVSAPSRPVILQRDFRASLAEVHRAWTDAARLRRWFQPIAGVEAASAEVEARPGGRLALEFGRTPQRVVLEGRFQELSPQRIVVELARHDGSGAGRPTRITAALAHAGGVTTLDVRHEGVSEAERAEVEHAWRHCLGRLAGVLGEALDRFYERLERYPRFYSRFGGLWPDLSDAEARIAGKQALGVFTAQDATLFRHWVAKGFVVLEGAVDPALADRLRAEMENAWERGDPRVTVEVFEGGVRSFPRLEPRFRDAPHKVLDYHGISATAREVQFAPAVRRFLGQLFERPLLAFQSLYFRWGTEQDMHQDTAYVVLRSPMELVGCWAALEDIAEGSGELQYYVGSHRIPEYLWFERARARPYELDDDRDFLRHVREEAQRLGCPLQRFRPRKGDVLLWHADLVHGGAKRELPHQTRQSLVTHYCPVNVDPEWLGEIPSSPKLEHQPGCFYCYPLRDSE
jgi:uncharacterized protein YndB with AHSA1/START domain